MIKIDPISVVDARFVGIPYKLGGKSFDGADCIGVVILWLKEQGLEYDYDDRDALRMKKYWETSPGKFVDMVSEYGVMITFPQVRKYDFLLFFAGQDSVFPTLPAVMVDDRFMLLSHRKDAGS